MNDGSGTRLALYCRWLCRTVEPGQIDSFTPVCTHPVRDGEICTGPFLFDLNTNCGLWEQHPQPQAIPFPQLGPGQRRRRNGYNLRGNWQDGWR